MKITPDTETTGLSIHQKDVPFLVMIVEDAEDGSALVERLWEIEIDPKTRKWSDTPQTYKTVEDFDEYVREADRDRDVEWVFHNSIYDFHALEPLTSHFLEVFSLRDDSLKRLHDTLTLSHVYDNLGTHGLKELGMSYLSERPKARDDVKEAVKAIRRHAKSIEGVQLGGEAAEDYWLPAHIARYCPEVVERVTPSIAPYLKKGRDFWRESDEKLFTRKESTFTEEEHARKKRHISEVRDYLENVAAIYGMQDVHLTIKLYYVLEEMIDQDVHKDRLWKTYERERRVAWQIYQMQRRGIRLKPNKLKNKIEEFDQRIAVQTSNLRKLVSVPELNPDSSPQMQRVFYGDEEGSLGFQPTKLTGSGNPSCDKEVVGDLLKQTINLLTDRDRDIVIDSDASIPVPFDLDAIDFESDEERREYEENFRRAVFLRALSDRKAHTAALGYLRSYQELGSNRSYPYSALVKDVTNRIIFDIRSWNSRRDPCLYGNWNPSGTGTSRLSSSHPNTQNWSKGKGDDFDEQIVKATIRDIFGPDIGDKWLSVDYSQLQVRIFAYLSGDKTLIALLEAGGDTHTAIAKRVYGTDSPSKAQRRKCKPITFGTLFGAGYDKVALMSGIPNGYAIFMEMFKDGRRFIDETVAFARRHGYVLLPDGSRLNIPRDRVYAAFCYVIQGMEAVIMKEAMIALELALEGTPLRAIYQVHDEMGFEFLNPFRHPGVGPSMSVPEKRIKTDLILAKCVERVVTTMEGAGSNYGMRLPVEVEYTDTHLGDLHKWDDYALAG